MFTAERADKVVQTKVPPYFGDTVAVRVKEASPKPSGAGSPMVTLKCEIIRPTTVQGVDGKEYAIDNIPVSIYFVLKGESQKNTDNFCKAYYDFRAKMGLDPAFDEQNPDPSDLIGKCFEIILGSEEDIATRKNAKGEYEPIKGGDGKPMSRGWRFKQVRAQDIIQPCEA